MIYLVETTYYDKENGKVIDLLKIGFAEEFRAREKAYITHNPRYKLLNTRCGNINLETYLHRYFSKYRYPGASEWYYYDEYIINNFEKIQMENDFYEFEDYMRCLYEYVIDKLPTVYELSKKHLDSLLNELKGEYTKRGLTFPLNIDRYRSFVKNVWRDMYGGKANYLLNPKDYYTIHDYPEFISLKKYPIENQKDELKDILSRLAKIDDDIVEEIKEKKVDTDNLLKVYNLTQEIRVKHSLARVYRDNPSFGDYISVGIEPGSGDNWMPYFDDIAHLAETKALEIYQKELADKFGFKPEDIC